MQFLETKEGILIVDFGSQVTKLIARRIRELGVYSEIVTPQQIIRLKNFNNVKGIILSGGPSSVTKGKFQSIPKKILTKKIPILGNLLWFTINCKTLRWKNKIFEKKERIRTSYNF